MSGFLKRGCCAGWFLRTSAALTPSLPYRLDKPREASGGRRSGLTRARQHVTFAVLEKHRVQPGSGTQSAVEQRPPLERWRRSVHTASRRIDTSRHCMPRCASELRPAAVWSRSERPPAAPKVSDRAVSDRRAVPVPWSRGAGARTARRRMAREGERPGNDKIRKTAAWLAAMSGIVVFI